MGQPKLTITIQSGGLSRVTPDENPISGLLVYSAVMPLSGWTSSGYTVKMTSITDAEKTYGITSTGDNAVAWFQINEFFAAAPTATLYVGIYPTGATYDFAELTKMQLLAQGKIRRVGIQMDSFTGITSAVGDIQTQCVSLYNADMPMYVIYAPNSIALSVASAPSVRASNAKYVGVFVTQDTANDGYALSVAKSFTVSPLGRLLGFNASAGVNINIGWIGQYDFTNGAENSTINIGTSDFWNITNSTLDTLNDNGYMFLKKVTGLSGSYLNDMPAACSATDDYAYLPETNTMLKAVRNVRAALLPLVNSPIGMNDDGTISYTNCKNFENTAGQPLTTMLELGEISNFKTFCDPDQSVLSTSTVNVVIGILPTATARWIQVSIGMKASL